MHIGFTIFGDLWYFEVVVPDLVKSNASHLRMDVPYLGNVPFGKTLYSRKMDYRRSWGGMCKCF